MPAKAPAPAPAAAPPAPPLPATRKWFPGAKDDSPPNYGSKRIPVGAAGCLAGKTFVITGVSDSLPRNELEQLIQQYGGKVTGSVSGKTSFLLLGIDTETGQLMEGSKSKKARDLKTPIIDEDKLLDMIRATAPQPPEPAPAPEPAPMSMSVAAPPRASGGAAGSSSSSHDKGSNTLWAEKYRPESIDHLVGNGMEVKRLLTWLNAWQASPAAPEKGDKKGASSGGGHRAALVSGPPGIGKTSAARVVLQHCGFDVVELNASDTRSQKALKQCAEDLVGNTSIADFASGGRGATPKRMALIMDEVDGMSSGDRGGVGELIVLIKRTKMPVICVCNDRGCQKIRSLASHCMDLQFKRPTPKDAVKTLRRVAGREGYAVDDATLEKVAEACNADIRQMLNLLQIWRPQGQSLTAEGVAANMNNAFKDVAVGAFDVGGKFFREPNRPLDAKLRDYFVDGSMTPLLVQDSYLNVTYNLPPGVPNDRAGLMKMQRAAQAAESIAEGDVVGNKIGKEQQWGLAPLHGVLACAKPAWHAQGMVGRPNFPSWLGRNSTATKRTRLLRECASHMQANASGDKSEIRQAYLPALRARLLRPLLDQGNDGIPEVLATLDEYGLSKDDFDAIMEFELLLGGAAPSISSVPSSVKAALTRKYNQTHQAVKKTLGSGPAHKERLTEDADDMDDDDGEEEETDQGERLVKQLDPAKKKAKTANGKAKARK